MESKNNTNTVQSTSQDMQDSMQSMQVEESNIVDPNMQQSVQQSVQQLSILIFDLVINDNTPIQLNFQENTIAVLPFSIVKNFENVLKSIQSKYNQEQINNVDNNVDNNVNNNEKIQIDVDINLESFKYVLFFITQIVPDINTNNFIREIEEDNVYCTGQPKFLSSQMYTNVSNNTLNRFLFYFSPKSNEYDGLGSILETCQILGYKLLCTLFNIRVQRIMCNQPKERLIELFGLGQNCPNGNFKAVFGHSVEAFEHEYFEFNESYNYSEVEEIDDTLLNSIIENNVLYLPDVNDVEFLEPEPYNELRELYNMNIVPNEMPQYMQ